MIYINEWLPNPAGADKGAEWVEIFNSGTSQVSLSGWSLVSGNGKKFVFGDKNIGGNGYLVLNQSETKLTLRNSDESLSLYNVDGKLVDKSSFTGSMPEGKSFSRTGDIADTGTPFIFAVPTPGQTNKITREFLTAQIYPQNQPLNKSFGYTDALGLALFVGLIYPFFIIVIFKKNAYLSKLFFDRD